MKLILPVLHFEWQVLRAVGRSRKPVPGRALRLAPTRRTKDGSFLTALVSRGLLTYATGGEGDPFGATCALTPLGAHAAEYGECETEYVPRAQVPKTRPVKAKRAGRRGSTGSAT
ncbi:hypothetical protein VT84_06460 [Gemmata sp. SH-PL17]|uniref:hypothetical protein n=1 Tax=Gemmata sp. SH-PL17 TaxID=1630693 RepID=UPI00078E1678|nr:hypothetical protein [Gemmata sp. SH-PL17]AMV24019.1 hypothetical protein VT84_06460 [Gemmata sp. SH-PL17]